MGVEKKVILPSNRKIVRPRKGTIFVIHRWLFCILCLQWLLFCLQFVPSPKEKSEQSVKLNVLPFQHQGSLHNIVAYSSVSSLRFQQEKENLSKSSVSMFFFPPVNSQFSFKTRSFI